MRRGRLTHRDGGTSELCSVHLEGPDAWASWLRKPWEPMAGREARLGLTILPDTGRMRNADISCDRMWTILERESRELPWSCPRGHAEGSQQIPGAGGRMDTEDRSQPRCIHLGHGSCRRESPERVSPPRDLMDPAKAESRSVPEEFCIGLVLSWDSFYFKHSNQQKLL